MPDAPKISPAVQARIDAKKKEAEAKATADAENKRLAGFVGQTYYDGESPVKVTSYDPATLCHGKWQPGFYVNFGNPNRHDPISCEEFFARFTPEPKGAQ